MTKDSWDNKTKKNIMAAAAYTPFMFEKFQSVLFMGDEFMKSELAYYWALKWNVKWKVSSFWTGGRVRTIPLKDRIGKICYFIPVGQRQASLKLTKDKLVVEKITQWIELTESNDMIWTANVDNKPKVRFGAGKQHIRPKSHGENIWSDYQAVVWLVAMKVSPVEVALKRLIFGG